MMVKMNENANVEPIRYDAGRGVEMSRDQKNDTAMVRVSGALGYTDQRALRSALAAIGEKLPKRVVIDVSDLAFMSSPCRAALIDFQSQMRAAGVGVSITRAGEVMREMLRLTRLDEFFHVEA